MTDIGICAALISALSQATAHSLLKAGRDKLIIRALIAATCSLAVLPFVAFAPLPSGELWRWLIVSSVLHTIYQFVLVMTYGAAEFSVAYPVARGIVPLSTAAISVWWMGERLTYSATLGVLAVTAGLLTIAVKANVRWNGLKWAIVAGLLTTLYTIVDGYAVRVAPFMATFVIWFFLLDGLIMVPLVASIKRKTFLADIKMDGRHGFYAGVASLITYGAALVALRYLPVGIAAALRESSVSFAAIIAFFGLREQFGMKRVLGIVLILGGSMLIVHSLS